MSQDDHPSDEVVEQAIVDAIDVGSPLAQGGRRLVVTTTLTNVGIGVMGAATGALTARVLGPSGRGDLAAIQLWSIFLAYVAVVGMPESLSYFAARARDAARTYFATGLVMAGVAGAAIAGIAILLMPLLVHSKGAAVITDARWYLFYIPLYGLVTLPAQLLRGAGEYNKWNIQRLALGAMWFLVLFPLWILRHDGTLRSVTPGRVAALYLAGLVVVMVPFMVVALRTLPGRFWPQRELVSPLVRFGVPAMGATFPAWLNVRADQLVMVLVVSSRQLGLYVVAVAWSQVIYPLINGFGAVLLPRLAAETDPKVQTTMLARSTRQGVLLASIIVIPSIAITPPAVHILFGAPFDGSVVPAMILVGAGALLGLTYVASEGLFGVGRPRGPMNAQFLGLAITIVSLAALLPTLGITGAAIASVLGYGATFIWLVVEIQHRTGVTYRALLVPKVSDIRGLIRG